MTSAGRAALLSAPALVLLAGVALLVPPPSGAPTASAGSQSPGSGAATSPPAAPRAALKSVGKVSPGSVCNGVYPPTFSLATGMTNDDVPVLAKPARGRAFTEPTYRTCVVRATDHAADGAPGFTRNDYSRRQPFNADSSRFIASSLDGSWGLYDSNRLSRIKDLRGVGGDAEPQWHPTNPDLLYYLPHNGGLVMYELDVKDHRARVVADFNKRLPWPGAEHVWTKAEGSPSRDGRYWAFMVEDGKFNELGFVVWDRDADAIVSTYATNRRPDHLSMSPSGEYVVVSWDDGVVVLDRSLRNPRTIHKKGEHSDIAVDANGDDVYVSVDYDSNDGAVYMWNLRTGVRTDLFPTYLARTATAMHFSGKAFGKPGWVLMSTYGDYGGSRQWLHRKVFAVSLQPNPKVHALAHHHGVANGYWTEPHASVNRDFTKVLFNSNWEVNSSTDVDAYMIELPPGALDQDQP